MRSTARVLNNWVLGDLGGMSLTQYQMFSGRLDAINGEMAGYEAQVAEASKGLKKLLKEAEESKVNPDWVK